jgi:hypothetical protein
MNWGLIVALVALLEGVGIFLDKCHFSHPAKERFRLLLVDGFFWLERTKIKTLPILLIDKIAELKGSKKWWLTILMSCVTFIVFIIRGLDFLPAAVSGIVNSWVGLSILTKFYNYAKK